MHTAEGVHTTKGSHPGKTDDDSVTGPQGAVYPVETVEWTTSLSMYPAIFVAENSANNHQSGGSDTAEKENDYDE